MTECLRGYDFSHLVIPDIPKTFTYIDSNNNQVTVSDGDPMYWFLGMDLLYKKVFWSNERGNNDAT